MGTRLAIYIGPFAEWLVPKTKYEKIREKWEALIDELQSSPEGCLEFDSASYDNEVVVGRKRFIRECWTAFFGLASSQAAKPPRKFLWGSNDYGIWEFSGFAIEQEKLWFQETFARQLKLLVEAYGVEPEMKWGVVTRSL